MLEQWVKRCELLVPAGQKPLLPWKRERLGLFRSLKELRAVRDERS